MASITKIFSFLFIQSFKIFRVPHCGVLGLGELSHDSDHVRSNYVVFYSSHVCDVTRGVYVLKTLHFWPRGARSNDHHLVDRRKSKSARAMPTFRKLDEYSETEDWRHYIERVNHFFEAKEITDPDKKDPYFMY